MKFCDDDEVPRLINSPFFRELNPIDDNTYEVESSKKKIKLDLPLQVGFFVYQYAKLRMLQGILRNPDRTRTRTWTRTRRKPGLGKNPDSCSDSRLRNPDSTIENPDSKSKILDSMKLDSDNIRNKFSSLICFWVS